MDKVVIGKRIREARLEKKMTQEQLSEAVNISAYYLGELERGIKLPSLTVLVDIAEALNVSTDYILRDTLSSGIVYINNEITDKLDKLTPNQRAGAVEILNIYIKALQ